MCMFTCGVTSWADLEKLYKSIKNWMGPNPNGPLSKLRSSYEILRFRGPFSGSCWIFLGIKHLYCTCFQILLKVTTHSGQACRWSPWSFLRQDSFGLVGQSLESLPGVILLFFVRTKIHLSSWELAYSPFKGAFKDGFPFPIGEIC